MTEPKDIQSKNGDSRVKDPAEWFDGVAKVLFVHAHPDDETIATGGTIAALAKAGLEPAVLTYTRGEQGEVTETVQEELREQTLTELRVAELSAALKSLGVKDHAFLGSAPARQTAREGQAYEDTVYEDIVYEDSGMEWGPDGMAQAAESAPANALTMLPSVDVIYDTLAFAVSVGATAIVSYDEKGGYGHPDHVLAHRAARAVAHGLEIPFWSIVEGEGTNGEDAEGGAAAGYDISPWIAKKLAALRCYRSQLTVLNDHQIEHVGGQIQEISYKETFQKHENLDLRT